MQVSGIRTLLNALIDNDWDATEMEGEKEEFAEFLKDMNLRAGEDTDALFAFLAFVSDQMGATTEWDSKELNDRFSAAYQGGGDDIVGAIKQYCIEIDDPELKPLATSQTKSDLFPWEEWANSKESGLAIQTHGNNEYLFQEE